MTEHRFAANADAPLSRDQQIALMVSAPARHAALIARMSQDPEIRVMLATPHPALEKLHAPQDPTTDR